MKKYISIILTTSLISLALILFVNPPKWVRHAWKERTKPKQGAYYTNHPETQSIWKNLSVEYPVVEKKPIVVVIASYNNESICEKNLQSVFEQTYDNYRVIYIDDCSTDRTYEKVKNFIKLKGQEDRVTLIHNQTKSLKMKNLYQAYHSCQDQDIIVCLDGDDYLAHERVLDKVNRYYQNPEVWLTYGSAIIHPQYDRRTGMCLTDRALLSNEIRDSKRFEISMLRTFYAGLFKQIKLKDLFYQETFFPSADDVAFMIPMIEMAGTHVLFVPEILYIINDNNPIREHKVTATLQDKLRCHVFEGKEKYEPLSASFDPRDTTTTSMLKPIQLLLLSEDNPLFLSATLESCVKHLSPLEKISVFYTASTDAYRDAYNELASLFSKVNFIERTALSSAPIYDSHYVLVGNDNFVLSENVTLSSYIRELDQTGAKGFYLSRISSRVKGDRLDDNLFTVSVSKALKLPDLKSDSFLVLMRKEDAIKTFLADTLNPKGVVETLLHQTLAPDEMCLFHEISKTAPLTAVTSRLVYEKSDLLKKFEEGCKLNLTSFINHKDSGIQEGDFIVRDTL